MRRSRQVVRVRFAPSPTGYLHVGGARTAIFNWLFAKNSNGVFILRIEDTDVERSTRESEKNLIEDLRWLGLDWDEGPEKGGPFAPYRQSERLSLYKQEAEKLVHSGAAYPCFCSEEDLEKKRRDALEQGSSPRYDGTCRSLSAEEIEQKRKKGEPEVIRFQVPGGVVMFEDSIRGDLELSTSMVGDFVLLRSNGLPTYNFAAVVDDASMGITHVLRGEEHLPNTLRQILLYRALGAEPPIFCHLPLILGKDRSKLSKRHGASSVSELRKRGYLPAAMVNYLALLGWSHPSGREVLRADELVGDFSLERVNKSAAIFDMAKMSWMNGMHIRETPAAELFPKADEFFPTNLKKLYPEQARLEIFKLVQEKVDSLSDIERVTAVFNEKVSLDKDSIDALSQGKAEPVLTALMDELKASSEELSPALVKEMIGRVGKACGARGKALYFPIRAAVTGSVHGPELAGVIAVRGKDNVLSLLEKARSLRG